MFKKIQNKGLKTSSKEWLQRHINDQYVIQAKRDGYNSRAAYKLIQIDEKFKLFKPNYYVVDLGSAPGGWSQVAARKVGADHRNVKVVAVDLLHMDDVPGALFIQGDFQDEDVRNKIALHIGGGKCNVIISDMAPNTLGNKNIDHLRIMGLCQSVCDFAHTMLENEGSMVCKVFMGGMESGILAQIKKMFKVVKHFKPQASRKESNEIYLVATGFRNRD